MNISFVKKLRENLLSVALICAIVLLLHITGAAPLPGFLVVRFLVGALLIILGLTFFLIGVDLCVTPLGEGTGKAIARSGKLWIALAAGLILGFFTSLAEPGLMVLADQVGMVTMNPLTGISGISGLSVLIFVSVGLAALLAFGFARIALDIPLHILLIILYVIIGAASFFTAPEFLGIAFDASGATTGILAVPFILALAVGTSRLKRSGLPSEQDSFGLVAIASSGAVMGIIVLNFISSGSQFSGHIEDSFVHSGFDFYLALVLDTIFNAFITLLPIFVIFLIMNLVSLKLNKRAFVGMLFGFLYSFIGLVLFFLGVDGGFMEVGRVIGAELSDSAPLVTIIGFFIGFVTILAEPAVYVLTHQIEDITSGNLKRATISVPLCIGVGLAVLLSVIRILVPAIQLWHYLLPGYFIALSLSLFTPKLFVGIAFDAGGVATGPMTATFILAFTQGVANSSGNANLLTDGFGMISMVALMPIITLQILGLIYKKKTAKGT